MVGTATRRTQTVERVKPEPVRLDLELVQRAPAPPSPRRWRAVFGLVLFGVASAAAYGLFFGFIEDIFPRLTSGTIGGAVAVLGLALTFSLIHGSFAGALLELVGIRELKKG